MHDSKITYRPSAKAKILIETQERINSYHLVFTDELTNHVPKSIEENVNILGITTLSIVNTALQRKVGVINFEDSSYSRFNRHNKIIWKIYIDDLINEKDAKKIANSIEAISKRIIVRIIANS